LICICDDEVVPLHERIDKASGEADPQELYATEHDLL
jgi:hypothetical protein